MNLIGKSGINLLVKIPKTPVTKVVRIMAIIVFLPRCSVPQSKSSGFVVSGAGFLAIQRPKTFSRK